MRNLRVAAAQLGPISKDSPREQVVQRMARLMQDAAIAGAQFVVYPELALTTFFPRYFMRDTQEINQWFESCMPNPQVQPLFDLARELAIEFSFGFAELTENGRRFNTSVHVDALGNIVAKYRKIHLPGHSEFDTERTFQHLEKRYFEPGDLGFQAYRSLGGVLGMCICNDRRWPETYRELALQGVEMITLGYNTPSVNSQQGSEGPQERMFHHLLVLQAGAYQNSCWVVAVAKAGDEDGHPLLAGSVIVDPNGKIVARTQTEGDELIVHSCNLDDSTFGKETIFDFARHRRPEHYQRIANQTGVKPLKD